MNVKVIINMYKIILNMMFVHIGSISNFTNENSNEKICNLINVFYNACIIMYYLIEKRFMPL